MKLLTFLLTGFVMLLGSCIARRDNKSVFLKKVTWNRKFAPRLTHYYPASDTTLYDSTLYFPGEKLWVKRFGVRELYFLVPGHGIGARPSNRVKMLHGVTDKYDLLVVVDKNFNGIFSDDHPYIVRMKKPIKDYHDFVSRLPSIQIDSLQFEIDGSIKTYSMHIKVAPVPTQRRYFSSRREVAQSRGAHFKVFDLGYYYFTFFDAGKKYHAYVRPGLYPLRHVEVPLQHRWPSAAHIQVYQKKGGKYREVGSNFQFIPSPINTKRWAFHVGEKAFYVSRFSQDSSTITISELPDSMVFRKFLPKSLFSLTQKKEFIVGDFDRIALVEFSGSWCQPCNAVRPEVERLYQDFRDKLQFYTVLKERRLEDAMLYHQAKSRPWEVLFENLSCDEDSCISKNLEVGAYPTFVLIDQRGNVLFRESGIEAIKSLRARLAELSNTSAFLNVP